MENILISKSKFTIFLNVTKKIFHNIYYYEVDNFIKSNHIFLESAGLISKNIHLSLFLSNKRKTNDNDVLFKHSYHSKLIIQVDYYYNTNQKIKDLNTFITFIYNILEDNYISLLSNDEFIEHKNYFNQNHFNHYDFIKNNFKSNFFDTINNYVDILEKQCVEFVLDYNLRNDHYSIIIDNKHYPLNSLLKVKKPIYKLREKLNKLIKTENLSFNDINNNLYNLLYICSEFVKKDYLNHPTLSKCTTIQLQNNKKHDAFFSLQNINNFIGETEYIENIILKSMLKNKNVGKIITFNKNIDKQYVQNSGFEYHEIEDVINPFSIPLYFYDKIFDNNNLDYIYDSNIFNFILFKINEINMKDVNDINFLQSKQNLLNNNQIQKAKKMINHHCLTKEKLIDFLNNYKQIDLFIDNIQNHNINEIILEKINLLFHKDFSNEWPIELLFEKKPIFINFKTKNNDISNLLLQNYLLNEINNYIFNTTYNSNNNKIIYIHNSVNHINNNIYEKYNQKQRQNRKTNIINSLFIKNFDDQYINYDLDMYKVLNNNIIIKNNFYQYTESLDKIKKIILN